MCAAQLSACVYLQAQVRRSVPARTGRPSVFLVLILGSLRRLCTYRCGRMWRRQQRCNLLMPGARSPLEKNACEPASSGRARPLPSLSLPLSLSRSIRQSKTAAPRSCQPAILEARATSAGAWPQPSTRVIGPFRGSSPERAVSALARSAPST